MCFRVVDTCIHESTETHIHTRALPWSEPLSSAAWLTKAMEVGPTARLPGRPIMSLF